MAPARARAPWHAVALAVGLVILMIASGFAAASLSGSPAATPRAPTFSGLAPTSAVQSGAQLQKDPYTPEPSTHFSQLPGAHVLAPLAPASPVDFTVGFPMRNSAELQQLIAAQETPGSPTYHQWLSLAQEQSMFGPDPTVVQNTVNYFTSLGFHVGVEGVLSVSFQGTAAQADQAFHTEIASVGYGAGQTATMNTVPLSLPAPLAQGIVTVNGLDTSIVAHPYHFQSPFVTADEQNATNASSDSASILAAVHNVTASNLSLAYNNSNHAFAWFQYYSNHYREYRAFQVVTPGALTYLYNGTQLIDQGYNGNSTGTPITIAIVMAGGLNPDDFRAYGQLVWNNPNNIIDRIVPVPIDGSFKMNGTVHYTDDGSNEMALDVEYSSTMAPGARIMPVYGPCLCTNVLDDDYAAISGMVTVPNIVSNSWGGDEDTWPNLYAPNWQNSFTMHNYFMLLDARGSTVLASSGDGGGFDRGSGMLAGSFPATDPYVLSVNGVRTVATDGSGLAYPTNPTLGMVYTNILTLTHQWLRVSTATRLLTQSFWYVPLTNTSLHDAPPEASGGFGTSYWFNQSYWQHGFGVPDLGRSLGSGVAAEADFNESIFFDGTFEFFYGGTSFACPTVAGEFALIDDYLRAHGHSAYLGDGNVPVFQVANAYWNGNLSLVPFYDITQGNGTSYWGNHGVSMGWQWPPGQKFPVNATGAPIYGDTLNGYDFPTGWGTINVYNFALDLNLLEGLPGKFMTLNAAGSAYNVGAWQNMVLNRTYTVHVNVTSQIAATSPNVTVEFFGENGNTGSLRPTIVPVFTPSLGYNFTLDTSVAPFFSPGLVVFILGNGSNHFLGFGYTWVGPDIPAGNLSVSVVAPGGSSEVGGYPQFNAVIGGFFPPIVVSPSCCTLYPNTFTVHVTLDGRGVYNARVLAEIGSTSALAWEGSRAQSVSQSYGANNELSPTIVSQTFTNLTGYALVYTWNMVRPTTYWVNATYGSASAGTTYSVSPGPNVHTTDAYGGQYSQFNAVQYLLTNLHQVVSPANINAWAPNAVNQSAYYSLLYAWQGERFPAIVNDYTGAPMNGINVWLGTIDNGNVYRLKAFQPSGGVLGVTNSSGTSATTGANGSAIIQIPDNMSDQGFLQYPSGATAGLGFVAASVPGAVNRTFSYTEPCLPPGATSTTALLTCQFNDTYERNYTAVPLLILANPVHAFTQTPQKVARDFFGSGSNISFGVNISLPFSDPFLLGYGADWANGLEHITSVRAFVDGVPAADVSPTSPPNWQNYSAFANLSGTYAPGIHTLTVLVNDSMGHTFTNSHTFVVGSIENENLGINNIYTTVPYVLNWTINIPAGQVNNHTFSQSLEIRYVQGGCGGSFPCPQVVNYTIKVHPRQVFYNQSINMTLLNLNHFYGGAGELPPGQYQIIIWLNANHSGSIEQQVTTYLVFTTVQGSINGPAANATVPLGNVTISYAYQGGYIENASLSVFSASSGAYPVFTAGAFVPGTGLRGGASTWTAVETGTYRIVLLLGTPYANFTTNETIFVVNLAPQVYQNTSEPHPLFGLSSAGLATILAIVGGVVGLLLGWFVAPGILKGRPSGPASGPAAPKPWDPTSPGTKTAPESISCPVCHDKFDTPYAFHQHQKVVHGIEE